MPENRADTRRADPRSMRGDEHLEEKLCDFCAAKPGGHWWGERPHRGWHFFPRHTGVMVYQASVGTMRKIQGPLGAVAALPHPVQAGGVPPHGGGDGLRQGGGWSPPGSSSSTFWVTQQAAEPPDKQEGRCPLITLF